MIDYRAKVSQNEWKDLEQPQKHSHSNSLPGTPVHRARVNVVEFGLLGTGAGRKYERYDLSNSEAKFSNVQH